MMCANWKFSSSVFNLTGNALLVDVNRQARHRSSVTVTCLPNIKPILQSTPAGAAESQENTPQPALAVAGLVAKIRSSPSRSESALVAFTLHAFRFASNAHGRPMVIPIRSHAGKSPATRNYIHVSGESYKGCAPAVYQPYLPRIPLEPPAR